MADRTFGGDRSFNGNVDYMTGCHELEKQGLITLVWNDEKAEWGFEVQPPGVDLLEECGWPANDRTAQVLVVAGYAASDGRYESVTAALKSPEFKGSVERVLSRTE